jgi:coiled-coil domain-containing protein 55
VQYLVLVDSYISIIIYLFSHFTKHRLLTMMNISLSSAAKKQQKKKAKLSYGLTTKSDAPNVFGGGDDEDDEDEGNGRDQVNRALLREQDALRQRASAAMYDFDGTYENKETAAQKEQEPKKKESRYMKDLLQQAKKRNYERDMAHERKLAREQEAEEGEFGGKEKFITSAYKKALEERELWKKEEQQQLKQDELDDVKKRKDGLLGFYGNFNKNVSMGGHTATDDKGAEEGGSKEERPSFLDGFEAADGGEDGGDKNNRNDDGGASKDRPSFLDGFEASATTSTLHMDEAETKAEEPQKTEEETKHSIQQIRAEKIAQARLRYFQRRGITEQQALKGLY